MARTLYLLLLVFQFGVSPPRARAQTAAVNASGTTPRNYLQSAYTRIRPSSVLRAGVKEVRPAPLELRGPFSLELEGENQKHYARIAELDILFEMAGKQKVGALEERIDATTRREMSRYFRRLQILRARAVMQERSRL